MFLFSLKAPLCAIFISLFVTSVQCDGAVAYSQRLPPCNDRSQLAQPGLNHPWARGSVCRFCSAGTFRAGTCPSSCNAEGSCWCSFVANSKCTPCAEKLFHAPSTKRVIHLSFRTGTKWLVLSPKGDDSGHIEDDELANHDAEKWIAQQPPLVYGMFSFLKHLPPSFTIPRHAKHPNAIVFGCCSSHCSRIESYAACRAEVQADGKVFIPCQGRSASLFRRIVNFFIVSCIPVSGDLSLSLPVPVSVAAELFLKEFVLFYSESTLFSFWNIAGYKLDLDLNIPQCDIFGTNLVLNSSCHSVSLHASERSSLMPCHAVESKKIACRRMSSRTRAIDENLIKRKCFETIQSSNSDSVTFHADFLQNDPNKRKIRGEWKDRCRSVIAGDQLAQFSNLIGTVYFASFPLKASSVTRHLVPRCSASSSCSPSKISPFTSMASTDGRGFFYFSINSDIFTCFVLLALSVAFVVLLKAFRVDRASRPHSRSGTSRLPHLLGHSRVQAWGCNVIDCIYLAENCATSFPFPSTRHDFADHIIQADSCCFFCDVAKEMPHTTDDILANLGKTLRFSFFSVAMKFHLGLSSELRAFCSLWLSIISRSLRQRFGGIPISRFKLPQPRSQRQMSFPAVLLCILISSFSVNGVGANPVGNS
jgi:hypothetical protein